jgi:hypothetical protein
MDQVRQARAGLLPVEDRHLERVDRQIAAQRS